MRIHITCLNGQIWGSAVKTNQEKTLMLARNLGCDEMGIYKIPANLDSDNELNHRMDGIIAPLWKDDIVIHQYPSWNGFRFERNFINHVKAYDGVKLILFVQDVESYHTKGLDYLLAEERDILNRADVLILASERLHEKLVKDGVTVSKIVYQKMWDYPMDCVPIEHKLIRKMIFTGSIKRFSFLTKYYGKTPIEVFDGEPIPENRANIDWKGYRFPYELDYLNSKGGFGLVWSDKDYFDRYYSMNNPLKLGVFLADGIPVIIQRGSHNADMIEEKGYGFVVDSLDEASEKIQTVTEEEYLRMCENIRPIQQMITKGMFTTKTLVDAIICACE